VQPIFTPYGGNGAGSPHGRRTYDDQMTAAGDWKEALGGWAIPEAIISSAPANPWGFPVEVFEDNARRLLAEGWTPTHRLAAGALPDGGTLLDVGCGAGAASLPVAPPAGNIIAVDDDAKMLHAMAKLAKGLVAVEAVHGRWPDVAGQVGYADVAVCANVAYNVPDLGPFLEALTSAASQRVVLELTEVHPQAALSPFWQHFWDLSRPTRPTGTDAEAVVREVLGLVPGTERWSRPWSPLSRSGPENIAWLRRRLCLTEASDGEIARMLEQLPERSPSATVTLWWPGCARKNHR
jgi:SAM-dependent methyltransferase